jgi:hypothetical protein
MLASLLLYSSLQYYLIITCPFTSHSRQIAFIQTERSGLLKKNVRKGKPSVKMGRKATDPAEQIGREAELPGGPLYYRFLKRCGWKRHFC